MSHLQLASNTASVLINAVMWNIFALRLHFHKSPLQINFLLFLGSHAVDPIPKKTFCMTRGTESELHPNP